MCCVMVYSWLPVSYLPARGEGMKTFCAVCSLAGFGSLSSSVRFLCVAQTFDHAQSDRCPSVIERQIWERTQARI